MGVGEGEVAIWVQSACWFGLNPCHLKWFLELADLIGFARSNRELCASAGHTQELEHRVSLAEPETKQTLLLAFARWLSLSL